MSLINSEVGLEILLKEIKKSEDLIINSFFRDAFIHKAHKTPEEYIQKRSFEYAEYLKAKKEISNFRSDSVIIPLIKQNALKQLFEEAEKLQK